jgi:hypothetical protein
MYQSLPGHTNNQKRSSDAITDGDEVPEHRVKHPRVTRDECTPIVEVPEINPGGTNSTRTFQSNEQPLSSQLVPGSDTEVLASDVYSIEPNNFRSSATNFENFIRPVANFPTPKPKAGRVIGETLLIRNTNLGVDLTNPTDKDMVILRTRYKDFDNLNYTWEDYEAVKSWVAIEQSFELSDSLKETYRRIRPKPKLLRVEYVRGEFADIVRWCKREPQQKLNLWNSTDVVELLDKYDLTRDLSIFDLVTMTGRAKQCVAEGVPVYLGVPPSHVAKGAKQTTQLPQFIRSSSTPSGTFSPISTSTTPHVSLQAGEVGVVQVPSMAKKKTQQDETSQGPQDSTEDYSTGKSASNESYNVASSSGDPSQHRPNMLPLSIPSADKVPEKRFQVFRDDTAVKSSSSTHPKTTTALQDHTNLPSDQRTLKHAKRAGARQPPAATKEAASKGLAHEATTKHELEDDLGGQPARKRSRSHDSNSDVAELGKDNIHIQEPASGESTHSDEQAHVPTGPREPQIVQTPLSDSNPTILGAIKPWIPEDRRFKIMPGLFDPQHFNAESPHLYALHLSRQLWQDPLRPLDKKYVYLPPLRDADAINLRLANTCVSAGQMPLLFRDFTDLREDDFSALARCVRFAQSDAQRTIDWRLHPSHVHEIIQRTNPYGLELLISRTELVIGSYDSYHAEYYLLLCLRYAHIKHAQALSPRQYTAADMVEIILDLHRDLEFAVGKVLDPGDSPYFGVYEWIFEKPYWEAKGRTWVWGEEGDGPPPWEWDYFKALEVPGGIEAYYNADGSIKEGNAGT